VERSVTERYVVLDTEFVRGHLETINSRLLQLMGTNVEQWKQADQSARHESGDQAVKENGGASQIESITLIEEPIIITPRLQGASNDWEDEVYF
jgi:hypothetical protein